MTHIFDTLCAEISVVAVTNPLGRVAEVSRGTVLVTGFGKSARQGDRVLINARLAGEVLTLTAAGALVLTEGPPEGLAGLEFDLGAAQADIAGKLGITRLRANRLLGEARARGLLVKAFVQETIDELEDEVLIAALETVVSDWLDRHG